MSNVTFENLTKQYGEYKDTDGTEYCLKQYPCPAHTSAATRRSPEKIFTRVNTERN